MIEIINAYFFKVMELQWVTIHQKKKMLVLDNTTQELPTIVP